MINFILPILLVLIAFGSVSEAAIFSGTLKTKHGTAIAFCRLNAQPATGSAVEFDSDRSGNFSVILGQGEWTLSADAQQIQAWGFSQMTGITISIIGDGSVTNNLVLFADMPLRTPVFTFSRSSAGALSFTVKGQGGTMATIYSSTDLVTWSPYYSRAIATTGFSYSVGNPPGFFPRRYFRVGASND